MNAAKIIARMVLAWIALLAAQIGAGMLVHINAPPMPHALFWMMVSNTVVVLALGAAALRSDWRDWRLLGALFFIPAAIETVNLIEGVIFLTNANMDWRGIFLFRILSFAVAALLWLFVFRSAPVPGSPVSSPLPHRSTAQMLGRFALCAACYVFLYFLAGTIVFPYVRDFYATQHIPSAGQIVSLQFLLRGPVFILVCLTLLRMFRLPHLSGALVVGLAFTLLSGVATLILPNPIFPDNVRWAHFCEVTSSNFAFGFVVGWVWGHAQRVRELAHATA
jgi:hypothetical protein